MFLQLSNILISYRASLLIPKNTSLNSNVAYTRGPAELLY